MISSVNQIEDQELFPQHWNKAKFSRYTFEPFDTPPRFSNSLGNGAASGVVGSVNLLHTEYGIYEWNVLGGGNQTIVVPIFDRANGRGLDFAQDFVVPKGHQCSFSPNITTSGTTRGKHHYTVGQGAFSARLKVRAIAATAGNLDFSFGFFRAGAYQTALASYPDYAILHNVANLNTTDIRQEVSLASVVVQRDTTLDWINSTTRTFEVRIGADGRILFLVDGLIPTVPLLGMFLPIGAVVCPRTFFRQAGPAATDNLFYQEFECGFLPERGR